MRWLRKEWGRRLAAVMVLACVCLFAGQAWSARPGGEAATAAIDLPAVLDDDSINAALATLDDEDVRQLLAAELRKRAREQARKRAAAQARPGRLAALIEMTRQAGQRLHERLLFLKSGVAEVPAELGGILDTVAADAQGMPPLMVALELAAGFAAGLVVFVVLRVVLRGLVRGVSALDDGAGTGAKLTRLSILLVLDLLLVAVFCFVAVTVVLMGFEKNALVRLALFTYLSATIIFAVIRIAGRFVLAPRAPSLRLVPLTDADAAWIYRWISIIAAVSAYGFMTCGMLRLLRIGAALHLLLVSMVGLVVVMLLSLMILQKKDLVAAVLIRDVSGLGGGSLVNRTGARLAAVWHQLAIVYLWILWLVWSGALLLVGVKVVLPAFIALLCIPVLFFLDWLLKVSLDRCYRLIDEQNRQIAAETMLNGGGPTERSSEEERRVARFRAAIRGFLRLLAAGILLMWILNLWGVDVGAARTVLRAGFSILVTTLAAYVIWHLTSTAIEKKLRLELPDDDEDHDEGGAGGSRRGTLLVLLRKFILTVLVVCVGAIILSALGVDVGPLFAGAGIVGLAVGFGAQTLVKDIISGIFFLIDDAFRVGDYIKTGNAKGTVEHISIRSIRLRHHRGMVLTIPFSQMKEVTNFTRDYIIMKLDYRVKYDTDVEKVRKIVKKINKEIMKDEELGPNLLDKIKSGGVKALDDSAMIMRIKFKAVPGEQFLLRREIFKKLREKFAEAGIEFAHRNVTVYMPEGDNGDAGRLRAGAAAMTAVAQAEAEAAREKE